VAMRGSLRYELTKYRKGKRRPLSGVVPGVPYNSFGRSRRPVSGLPHKPGRPGYHHDLYLWGNPIRYRPNLNAPAVQEIEYDPYEPLGLHRISRAGDSRLPRGLVDSDRDIPIPPSVPEDDSTITEKLLMAMGARDEIGQAAPEGPRSNISEEDPVESASVESQLPVELRSIDQLPSLEDLKDAFLTLVDVLPEDHPDLMNVRMAMRKVRDHHITLSEIEDLEMGSEPLECDPLQQAEEFFEQQMTLLEKPFDEPMSNPAEMRAPHLFEGNVLEPELMPGEALPADFLMETPLEEIVQEETLFEAGAEELMAQDMMPDEIMPDIGAPYLMPSPAGYGAGVAADEINQAIDEVAAQPVPDEMMPDPFAQQYNPYMAAQPMFDQQIQYMADPFAVPGPCGPMGPMPGP